MERQKATLLEILGSEIFLTHQQKKALMPPLAYSVGANIQKKKVAKKKPFYLESPDIHYPLDFQDIRDYNDRGVI